MDHHSRKKHIWAVILFTLISASAFVLAVGIVQFPDAITAATKEAEPFSLPVTETIMEQENGYPTYVIAAQSDGYWYDDFAGGFSLTLPEEPTVTTRYAQVRSELSWKDTALSVYRETFASAEEVASYIVYSKSFLADKTNFSDVLYCEMMVGEYPCTYAAWTREKLSRVKDDLNCYSSFDIIVEENKEQFAVYSLYFKYKENVDREKILQIVKTFAACEPTVAASAVTLGKEDGPPMEWNTALAYRYLFSPESPMRWGIFDYSTVKEMDTMRTLQDYLGYHFVSQVVYTNVLETSEPTVNKVPLAQALSTICTGTTVPELTLQTIAREDGRNMVFCILQGEYDEFLHNYASAVAAYGKPTLMRLGNEMNGDWCPYSAFSACCDTDIYVEFYRYIYDIFQQECADNVIWVWNPNSVSFPNYKWNSELLYYPGDAYVNVVGMTAYNTGTYYEGEKWSTFSELYDELYERCSATYLQPLMITEFACSGNGGNKRAWIEDMFTRLAQMDKIKLAIWWNGSDYDGPYADGIISRPYYLSAADGSLDAFRDGVSSRFYTYLYNEKSK